MYRLNQSIDWQRIPNIVIIKITRAFVGSFENNYVNISILVLPITATLSVGTHVSSYHQTANRSY